MPPRTTARGPRTAPSKPRSAAPCRSVHEKPSAGSRRSRSARGRCARRTVCSICGIERRLGRGTRLASRRTPYWSWRSARAPVRVAERERADDLAGRSGSRGESVRVNDAGRSGREVGERVVVEGAEQVARLVLRRSSSSPQLAGELEAVLVVRAEPRELVDRFAPRVACCSCRATGCRRRRASARRSCRRRTSSSRARVPLGSVEVRRAVAATAVHAERRLAEEHVARQYAVCRRLHAAVPARAVAAVRRQLGRRDAPAGRLRFQLPLNVRLNVCPVSSWAARNRRCRTASPGRCSVAGNAADASTGTAALPRMPSSRATESARRRPPAGRPHRC